MPLRPHIHRASSLDIAVSLGKTAAQITSSFAPIPALGPVAELICGMIQLCQNVAVNRTAATQLRDRCHRISLTLLEKANAKDTAIGPAIQAVTESVRQIHEKMEAWTAISMLNAFLQQSEMSKEIERLHVLLDDTISSFHIIATSASHEWQLQFKLSTEQDHREVMDYLSGIQNGQIIATQAIEANRVDTQKMMQMMQQLLGENQRAKDVVHNGLCSNLYDVQVKSRELLPDFHLRSGEVSRVGTFPISGTSAMDIYEGMYLGREKVAIKVVRAVNSNEHSLRRFLRECEIWKELWKIDHGQHILPFYGFCQDDGPFPYMVSPWQQNGTVLNYVKTHDPIDYVRMVKEVAQGIQVLHSMNPPVVHGDIKAGNIVVNAFGNPLIADFGLSRIVEDVTGIPFSQSRGVSDSYRWFAPEVCIGQGVLSLGSDVYAYGMTVLEIITHEQPYNNIKHTTEVVIKSAQGVLPPRPVAPHILARGLDDNLWSLLRRCWAQEPSDRPRIQEVLEMFQ
ncbi:kinase-like domain-containing protein [Roridomyces roridus]|uniref:Kinase-like domain-containing protein n=1 Tax=Roridomyces roridus TaxID=1738132 RepID=A0AAD7C4D4_9AGAR|nr:kinase-like domain-containing protein [Roridomyces roridus]